MADKPEIDMSFMNSDGIVDLEAAAQMYERIVSALRTEGEHSDRGRAPVHLPLCELWAALPPQYITTEGLREANAGGQAAVYIEDLFDQLGKGRVAVPIAQLLMGVAPHLVTPQAHADQTLVELPLRSVVAAVDRSEFKGRTAQKQKEYRLKGIPDLFKETQESAEPPTVDSPRLASQSASVENARPEQGGGLPFRLGLRQRGSEIRIPGVPPPLPQISRAVPEVPPERVAEAVAEPPVMSAEDVARFSEAVSVMQNIESALEVVQQDDSPPPPGIDLPLQTILDLLPTNYVVRAPLQAENAKKVPVIIEDLYEQLAHGRVTVSISQLLFAMPRALVIPEAYRDPAPVALPLALVVGEVGLASLTERTRGTLRPFRLQGLPDLFGNDAPKHVSAPTPTPAPVPAAAPAPAQSPVSPAVPPVEDLHEAPETARLGGINLNTATAEQLLSLAGVTALVAANVIEYREKQGPFRSIFDLFKVPRIGRKTFRAITGMPYSRTHRHRIQRLMTLLEIPLEQAAHLPSVARALAGITGFSGCIVSDADGLLLAEAGAAQIAVPVSAVIPRLSQQVQENMKEIGPEPPDAMTILAKGRMFTIVPGANLYLTAVHDARRLTAWQLRHIQRVAGELQWLVSRRGYV
jgi:competence ComEA-like helix-hairpin-helix protein